MNSTMYEYFLKDNIKLWKAIFIEKQSGNIERVVELLRQLNNNTKEINLMKGGKIYE